MTTRKMKEFMEHNAKTLVISAELLTPEGNVVYTKGDYENADRTRYRFADGSQRTLTFKDARSAPAFNPAWSHGV